MKTKYFYFIIMILVPTMFSCKNDECCVVVATSLSFLLEDRNGNNLLNPNSGKISEADINIYYIINNEKVLFYNANLDYPKGFALLENQQAGTLLGVSLNSQEDITLIQLGSLCTDTIQAEFNRDHGNIICTKAWYNNRLVYDTANPVIQNQDQYIVIQKHIN